MLLREPEKAMTDKPIMPIIVKQILLQQDLKVEVINQVSILSIPIDIIRNDQVINFIFIM